MPGAFTNDEERVADPGPSWKVAELGHMLQSMMQLSNMVEERIGSIDVSKPVSIMTKDFEVIAAWAGARKPKARTSKRIRADGIAPS